MSRRVAIRNGGARMMLIATIGAGGQLVACGTNRSDDLTEAVSAVVSGATNVSDGRIPRSIAESETAAVAIGGVVAVAYNSPAARDIGERCNGYSAVGTNIWNGVSWGLGIHFSPWPGTAIYRGDPSIGAWDDGSGNLQIYVSTLAHSTAQWNSQPKQADGCISLSTYANMTPDRLCVVQLSQSTAPGGGASIVNTTCMNTGNVDGTALVVSGGTPYVASWDTTSRLVFYRATDGAQLASPLSSRVIIGHPIFTKNDNSVHLFAPDNAGHFWETFYNTSTGTWDAGTAVATATQFSWGMLMPFGLRGGKEYSAVYMPGSAGPGANYLFYRDNRGLIVGYSHQSGGIPGWSLAFTSEAGLSAFHPAAAVAAVPNEFPPYTGYHLALSYWDNSGGSAAVMKYTNSLSTTPTGIGSETPCPHHGYWGDYDEMAVGNNNSSNPTFYRFFTDSTKSACADTTDWSTSVPQHISVFLHGR